MLGNENRVTSHWGLFTIVFWKLWRNSGFNEISGVLPDRFDTFVLDILPVFFGKFEFGSEFGFFLGMREFGGFGYFDAVTISSF